MKIKQITIVPTGVGDYQVVKLTNMTEPLVGSTITKSQADQFAQSRSIELVIKAK